MTYTEIALLFIFSYCLGKLITEIFFIAFYARAYLKEAKAEKEKKNVE